MKRYLLILCVLLVPSQVSATDWIMRVKKMTGALQSASETLPSNNDLRAIADSFIYGQPGRWANMLTDLPTITETTPGAGDGLAAHVVNPDNATVLTDIGTMSGETFVPAAAGVLDKMRSLHELRIVRRFIINQYRAHQQSISGTAVAGDVGSTPDEIKARLAAAADAASKTVLGDDDRDPE